MIVEAIARVVAGEPLDAPQMDATMEEILGGCADAAQIAALAVALRMRGETAEEIAAAARVLRRHCAGVNVAARDGSGVVLDTCGTGGDSAGTFNISTVSALAVAAAGVTVAKHGNRAVSSRAGSADVLEALGVKIDVPADVLARCFAELGIGFLFAPVHHAALRYAAPVRKALGLRTFFNLLGPLANPAGATHQLVGVFESGRVRQIATVLGLLGLETAWVVYGMDGLDEISASAPTRVAELRRGVVREFELTPPDFGLRSVPREALSGGDAGRNAAIALEILAGRGGDARMAIVLNAGAALHIAGRGATLVESAALASEALDSGAALRVLERWRALTHARGA